MLLGWLRRGAGAVRRPRQRGELNAILILLQLLSIIVFIGGFAVMLWYAYTAWRNGWRWPGKVWSILLVIAAGTVLYVGLVFKLVALTTNY